MPEKLYQIRRCIRPDCQFRFPVPLETAEKARCPKCRAVTVPADEPHVNQKSDSAMNRATGPEMEVVLDNIRSTFNVGAMFRAADGAGIRHIHLCGITPTPLNPKVGKTALGAEQSVPWTQHADILSAIQTMENQGMRLWALEGGPRAVSIYQAVADLDERPIALIVGNEVSGVDPSALERCEKVIAIPMMGGKESLNVAIAYGIAVYTLRFGGKVSY